VGGAPDRGGGEGDAVDLGAEDQGGPTDGLPVGEDDRGLKDQRIRQKADQKLVGSACENSGLVFTMTTGGLLHPINVLPDFATVRRGGLVGPRTRSAVRILAKCGLKPERSQGRRQGDGCGRESDHPLPVEAGYDRQEGQEDDE
jgi:hypothetical protein